MTIVKLLADGLQDNDAPASKVSGPDAGACEKILTEQSAHPVSGPLGADIFLLQE